MVAAIEGASLRPSAEQNVAGWANLEERLRIVDEQLDRFRALLHERECLQNAISALKQIENGATEVPIWQAAKDLLERHGKPITAKQIMDGLLVTGMRIEGKHRMEIVRVSLIRKPEVFEKMRDGRFQLAAGGT
jgi:hypothetical protein